MGKQSGRRTRLDRMAEIDHHHLIGDMFDHRQIMADEDIGQPEFLLDIGQQVQHLRTDRHIQRRNRLVEHQNFGPQHQSARNGDALALAARKHMRIAGRMFGAQADPFHHRHNSRSAIGCRHIGIDLQRLFQRATDRLAGIERAIGILKHDLHLGAQFFALLHGRIGQINAADGQ